METPYINNGAGRLLTERGRDALRGQIRELLAEGRRLKRDKTPRTLQEEWLIDQRIRDCENWLDRLGKLQYRDGRLVTVFERFE